MKTAIVYAVSSLLLLGTSASVLAEMQMGNNSVASMTPHRPPAPMHQPSYSKPQPSYPSHRPGYPNHRPHYPTRPLPSYPSRPYPPYPQSGISLHYQAPTTIIQNSQSYSWVNGDPNVAHIESSTHVVITDWRRLGLPAPPNGMHWILENGRYILVPNE